MNYSKPPLTVGKQADLLLHRGMLGERDLMISRLTSVNYYRLSGYWYPFRRPDDSFEPGTTFEEVWNRYVFDRHLRLVVMDAIERIEIAIRAKISLEHSHAHGPFAYATDSNSLPKLRGNAWRRFVDNIQEEKDRSKETFVSFFNRKYGDPFLPVWMATEVMSFGTVLTFYRGATKRVKGRVADLFNMPDAVFDSWLLMLNAIRNICAHHCRLWNRVLGVKPLLPDARKYPAWHVPVVIPNDRLFVVLTICNHCLRCVAPQSQWPNRLRELFARFPTVPARDMGFPPKWQDSHLWK